MVSSCQLGWLDTEPDADLRSPSHFRIVAYPYGIVEQRLLVSLVREGRDGALEKFDGESTNHP